MVKRRNNLFATKIKKEPVSQDLPTHHVLNNHVVQDYKQNSQKNLHNSGIWQIFTAAQKKYL